MAPLTGLVLLRAGLAGIILTDNQTLLLIALFLAFLLISWFLSLIVLSIHSRSRTGTRET